VPGWASSGHSKYTRSWEMGEARVGLPVDPNRHDPNPPTISRHARSDLEDIFPGGPFSHGLHTWKKVGSQRRISVAVCRTICYGGWRPSEQHRPPEHACHTSTACRRSGGGMNLPSRRSTSTRRLPTSSRVRSVSPPGVLAADTSANGGQIRPQRDPTPAGDVPRHCRCHP
jgi:hypothetical protein